MGTVLAYRGGSLSLALFSICSGVEKRSERWRHVAFASSVVE